MHPVIMLQPRMHAGPWFKLVMLAAKLNLVGHIWQQFGSSGAEPPCWQLPPCCWPCQRVQLLDSRTFCACRSVLLPYAAYKALLCVHYHSRLDIRAVCALGLL